MPHSTTFLLFINFAIERLSMMKENGTLEKMGWTLSDDWEDHLLARLWLFAVVVLIGYSKT